MSAYALHPEAFIDLDDIREHIAEDNPDAADRVIAEVFDGIRALVAFPCQGYRRPHRTKCVSLVWPLYSGAPRNKGAIPG